MSKLKSFLSKVFLNHFNKNKSSSKIYFRKELATKASWLRHHMEVVEIY